MATPLPVLSFTVQDLADLVTIGSQCTVRCEIAAITSKPSKTGGTSLVYKFVCIDENSPEFGHPSFRYFPMAYKSMQATVLCAVHRIEKSELVPDTDYLNGAIGKTLFVKFDLLADGRGGYSIQAADYFRDDKPLT